MPITFSYCLLFFFEWLYCQFYIAFLYYIYIGKLLSQLVHVTDVATELLEKYPEQLVVARYDINKQTAFHLLARKSSITPSEKFG